MNRDVLPDINTQLLERILATLQSIDAKLSTPVVTDPAAELLAAIIRRTGKACVFSASELAALAANDSDLRAVIAGACGELNGRKLGRLGNRQRTNFDRSHPPKFTLRMAGLKGEDVVVCRKRGEEISKADGED